MFSDTVLLRAVQSFDCVGVCIPSRAGLYQDAQASWDFLHSRHDIDQKKLIVFGRSLGGAVAIHLAASLGHNNK